MHALVLKHAEMEGPGTLGRFLESRGVDVVTLELFDGDAVPEDPGRAAAVVLMGGPMNVYEEDRYPFLRDEDRLLRETLRRGVPVLGICLGAQLLAKACGARVKRALLDEVGWFRVRKTPAGTEDVLFRGLGDEFDVFQWHEDTFEIPEGGAHLAESDLCRNQAFRFGTNAYGLQYHIEVTGDMLRQWYRECPERDEAVARLQHNGSAYEEHSSLVYMNFLSLMLAFQNGSDL